MHSTKSLAIVVLAPMIALSSCSSTRSDAVQSIGNSAQPSAATQRLAEAELGAREASRSVERLRALIAADRQALEVAENHLARVRSLFDAGRVSSTDLRVAEQQLLELRKTLQSHEQELTDAQQAAVADGATRGS